MKYCRKKNEEIKKKVFIGIVMTKYFVFIIFCVQIGTITKNNLHIKIFSTFVLSHQDKGQSSVIIGLPSIFPLIRGFFSSQSRIRCCRES